MPDIIDSESTLLAKVQVPATLFLQSLERNVRQDIHDTPQYGNFMHNFSNFIIKKLTDDNRGMSSE